MARYIDADKLILKLNEEQIEFDKNYYGLGEAKQIVDNTPTADVVERAKVLDRIKQSKDEIKAYYEYATDEKQKMAFNACLIVLDKLIAEVEG